MNTITTPNIGPDDKYLVINNINIKPDHNIHKHLKNRVPKVGRPVCIIALYTISVL